MKKMNIVIGIIVALLLSSCAIHTQHPSQINRHHRYGHHHKKPKPPHRGKKKGHYKKHYKRYGFNLPNQQNTSPYASKTFHYGAL